MVEKKLQRKERERLLHKQEMLDTALRLFSERGFHNVSMQEIASTSEFAVGTLYNFFESKDALFRELLDNCGQKIQTVLLNILDKSGTEIQKLSNFILTAPEILQDNIDVLKLYIAEFGVTAATTVKDWKKRELVNVLRNRLRQLIEQGIEKKIFRNVDPEITTMAILTTIETLACELGGNFNIKQARDLYSKVNQLFVEGLLQPRGQENAQ